MKKGDEETKKIVYLSGDHAGFQTKEKIKAWLKDEGFEVLDFGPEEYNKDDDYPDFIIPMVKEFAKKSVKGEDIRGIIFAGSGEGEGILANRFDGIRAAVYHGKNLKVIRTTRKHNNSNILCIGVRFTKEREVKKAVDIFLKTEFEGGRHQRRLDKIKKLR